MKIDKVASTIILYHPQKDELLKNINSFISQVDRLYLVDNSEEVDHKLIDSIKDRYSDIVYIQNEENLGIAKALNIACEKALQDGYEWILTMDQDSVFDDFESFLSCCESVFQKDSDIAIFAPNHSHIEKKSEDCSFSFKDIVITSGNLLSLEVWQSVGGFDSELFIDMVDYDLSYKVINQNKKIVFFKNQYLKHSLGTIYKRKNLITKKIKEKIEHSPQRVYYKTRNSLFLAKKYKQMNFLKTLNILYIHEVTKIVLYEDKKLEKFYAKILAFLHFLTGKKGKFDL